MDGKVILQSHTITMDVCVGVGGGGSGGSDLASLVEFRLVV